MKVNDIFIKPILTEKGTQNAAKKVYMFEVNRTVNKYQISTFLEKIYKVKVDHVRISVRKGKVQRVGKRMMPRKNSDKKIAYISLKEGKIDLFPQT